jgi:hypothetical protein
MNYSRKKMSMKGLLELVRATFCEIQHGKGEVKSTKSKSAKAITRTDCLMSAIAMFGLKYESLLQFDKDHGDASVKANIRNLYGVIKVPSDTYMRERLDEVNPQDLRPVFKVVFNELQRGKGLDEYQYLGGHYLVSADGTGLFESKKVHCDKCCEKKHRDGTKSYYHWSYAAAIVHPDRKIVIPLAPEQIVRNDGDTKNDCELNALKRLVVNLHTEHPRLKAIIVCDSIASKAPHIRLILEHGMGYILGAKESDHKALFDFVKHEYKTHEMRRDKKTFKFRYANSVPLNDSNLDLNVNFLECTEIDKTGKETTFSWVTHIELTEANLYDVMRGGRARWKIENETFNTLKNQGYHFEHNFGHGYNNLCSVLAMLMYLIFLIDQIAQQCDFFFQAALKAKKSKKTFWRRFRGLFLHYTVHSWDEFWNALIYGYKKAELQPYPSS